MMTGLLSVFPAIVVLFVVHIIHFVAKQDYILCSICCILSWLCMVHRDYNIIIIVTIHTTPLLNNLTILMSLLSRIYTQRKANTN